MDFEEAAAGSARNAPTAECLRPLMEENAHLETLLHSLEYVRSQMEERKVLINQAQSAKHRQTSNGSGSAELDNYIMQLNDQLKQMEQSCVDTLNNLLAGIGSVLQTASSAKETLLNKDLHNWKVQQKLAQIGPKSLQDALQAELDRLDPIFEQCGDELRKLRSVVEVLEQELAHSPTVDQQPVIDCRNQINMIIYQFVWESCVVARQPPCVLMKVRAPLGTDAMRRASVRPSCQPVLRLLGGTSLGLRVSNKEEVTCFIISEEQARNLAKPGYEVKPIGQLLHNKARFELNENGRYFASFNRPMALTDISRPAEGGAEAIPRQRYYLLFLVKLSGAVQTGGNIMTLQGGKLSLPVAALVHPRQEYEQGGDAYIFWDIAFSEGQGILTNVPRENHPGVPWPEAAKALNYKFQQLIEGSKPDVQVKNNLSEIAMRHLAEKFFGRQNDYSQLRLPWNKFFRETFLYRDNGGACTFREWFYKAAEIVHRKLLDHWNDGLILGFCSREAVEHILKQQSQATLIIKFSDNSLGCLILSYYIPGSRIPPQHLKVAAADLDVVPLTRCVRQCPELQPVQWIYPQRPIGDLWKNEENEEKKKDNPGSPNAKDPYYKKLFLRLDAEPRWDVPAPPSNIDLDTIYEWLSEQDMPSQLEVIPTEDLDVNLTGGMPLINDPSLMQDFADL